MEGALSMLQDYSEFATFYGSFLLNQLLYWVLPERGEDAPRLKSCYLSHIHCAVTITSCLIYWATNEVDVFSPKFMVEGPDGLLASWMRCTVAFSVGYFVNDFVLIMMHPSVGGADMIAHHIIIGGFFILGLLDRFRHQKNGAVYQISQILFAILFFVSRILVGTGLVWASGLWMLPEYILSQPSRLRQVHLTAQLAACTLSRPVRHGSRGLNLFWFWKIVKIVIRTAASKNAESSKAK
ncbi:hypothetical protein GUITHDRAFT_135418 [Guillardia theta CCMP2712]|uniref:TLC domain-containing protein n=1 Tax=Guillardia theta (strain CCMP2712) TaxID=905079 RepID=L1JNV0_GUITC|nr:hypothetical protein GUITHDRAFT_135418 [Guillardia theta CCMP2712]EKX50256.1 hypothetical protein GUITHDRAFT_135418 [Guillardia theta CCMP2712]|eukprot:XP_005837236.1 hypothetical protein GUITHDRAFT_135418 [Guillardia theta CCMP2712]